MSKNQNQGSLTRPNRVIIINVINTYKQILINVNLIQLNINKMKINVDK